MAIAITPRRALVALGLAAAAATAGILAARAPLGTTAGARPCGQGRVFDRTLANGAEWRLCWEVRPQEGIVLRDVAFRPAANQPIRRVLGRASLSQIHVPYDDNLARFHDLSDYGFATNAAPVRKSQCPGKLLVVNGTAYGCSEIERPDFTRYRFGSTQRAGQDLVIWSSAQIGLYNYTVRWSLGDDGSITPAVGASGALQRLGGDATTGWDVGPAGQPNYAVGHVHSYYFRLDFDVAGRGGDRIEQIQFAKSADRSETALQTSVLTTETAAQVDPTSYREWRVVDTTVANADGHRPSWELIPNTDHVFRGPDYEGWTANELYATVDRPCERFASHNTVVDGGCAGDSVDEWVNGEPLAGADVVVWYGMSFHHLPRDEEDPRMGSHWSSFTIQPRDVTARTPGAP